MAKNRTVDIPVKITNTGGTPLTGLQFEAQTSPGITAGVINAGSSLASGESSNITVRISSSSTAPDTGYATINVIAQGNDLSPSITMATFDAAITLVTALPIISTSPSYIDTGMVRGDQKIAEFSITNTGEETLKNARIEGLSTSWMSLTINKAIGDIKPGASTSVGILFRPPADLSQAVYDDTVVIYSDNHIPYTYHIQVTVTSNAVGNVLFDVLNEFFEDVPNATITFQHQLLTELIYTVKTGQDGSVMKYDIPEGRYTYNISPPAGHLPTSGTFTISPGLTTTVPIALEMKLVDITWSVTPTAIQDKYEITINQTFETHVPAPVLVVEPPNITLPDMQPGQVFNGEFKVTNYGLVEVYDVQLDFPRSFEDYDIEILLSVIPNKLGAMQSVTIPYRITRRLQTAFNTSLADEVCGYGGSSCIKTFSISLRAKCIICPNSAYAREAEKVANFLISALSGVGCSGGISGGGGGVWDYWTGGQIGGGGKPAPSPTPITPGKDCYKIAEDDFLNCTWKLQLADTALVMAFAACLCTGPGWFACVEIVGIVTSESELAIVAACGLDAYNVFVDCVGCGACGLH